MLRIAMLLVLLASLSSAQQPTTSAPSPESAPVPAQAASGQPLSQAPSASRVPSTPEEIEREKEIQKKEQSQHMLGVVPMFGVTSRHDAPPLTPGEKFHLMAKTFADPFIYVAVAAQAGIGQANNSFDEYGQGAAGYAKRYGANLADSADSNFFSNYFYPVIFRQDPRYFRLGEGPIKKRIWYAVEQEFVAHQDSGGENFHWSNVLGALTAGGISNAYYPSEDRGFGLTMSRVGISLLYGGLGNFALEFWPDIDAKLFHKKQSQAHPDEPPGTTPK